MAVVTRYIHTDSPAGGTGEERTFGACSSITAVAVTDEGGGTVGFACTSHTFVAGESISITNTVNYTGEYIVHANTTTTKIVFTATYVSETNDASEVASNPNRAYTSMPAWNSAEATDLTVDTDSHVVKCSGGADSGTAVALTGWTSSSTYDITIEGDDGTATGINDGSSRKVTNDFYVLSDNGSTHILDLSDNFVTVKNLQVRSTYTSFSQSAIITAGETSAANDVVIENCWLNRTNDEEGIEVIGDLNSITIKNCVLYSLDTTPSSNRAIMLNTGFTGTAKVYNCTSRDFDYFFYGDEAGNTTTVKNCFFGFECNFAVSADTMDYCAGHTDSGTNFVEMSHYDRFLSMDSSLVEEIMIPSTESILIGAGVGSGTDSDVPTVDILGNSRSTTAPTIGAFENGGRTAPTEIVRYINTDSLIGGGGESNFIGNGVLDAAAAVDKGSGQVGLPATGHNFVATENITITGTTNYDQTTTVDSVTANEIVITYTFTAETFAITDTIEDENRAYPQLITAEAAESDNFIEENTSVIFYCTGETTGPAQISGSATGYERAMTITAHPDAANPGTTYSSSYFCFRASQSEGSYLLSIADHFIKITNIQFENTSAAAYGSFTRMIIFYSSEAGIEISGNFFVINSSSTNMVCIDDSVTPSHSGSETLIANNVFYQAGSTGGRGLSWYDNRVARVYNNTFYGFTYGISFADISNAGGDIIKNNCIFGNTDDLNDPATNSTAATFDYNATDDGDGTNTQDMSPGGTEADGWNDAVTDYTTFDFSILDTGSVLYATGVGNNDDSWVPTTDKLGNERSLSAPSIGAFENFTLVSFIPRIIMF